MNIYINIWMIIKVFYVSILLFLFIKNIQKTIHIMEAIVARSPIFLCILKEYELHIQYNNIKHLLNLKI